ncbi:MAG TPA: hypothetical protein VNM35_07970, partial [Chitinophagaceae bacterium]|nr:hypothetical protein [Chitinophagaceae bacterium]
AVFALTYGNEINGSNGAGFELGVMLFTPPFACLGGCNTEKKAKKKKIKIIFVINLKKIWKKQMSNVRIKQAQLLIKRF